MVDMAHYAGLIAAGVYPTPVGIADYVTTTTHKTLRGPRGGIILAKAEHEKAINSAVFPGMQGGPLMHVIAAKAVAFGEALRREFKGTRSACSRTRDVLAAVLAERGLRIVSGGTDSHMFLVDLRAKRITGKDAEAALAAGAHHGQQERDPERSGEAVRDLRHAHRQSRRSRRAAFRDRGRGARPSDRRRARRTARDEAMRRVARGARRAWRDRYGPAKFRCATPDADGRR